MKRIPILAFILLAIFTLYGCGKQQYHINETFDSVSINKITIESGVHPVIIQRAEGLEITMSFSGSAKNIYKDADHLLSIQLPPQTGIIHIKEASNLIVGLPDQWNGQITINSESGLVKIFNVDLSNIAVKSEYGDIDLEGLTGKLTATSGCGKINVPNNLVDQVHEGDANLGGSFEATLGEEKDNTNKLITLYTDAGNIKIE